MASEDVLERAEVWLAAFDLIEPKTLEDESLEIGHELIRALAAEVRELRRDKARLDWLSSIAVLGKHRPDGRSLMGIYVETRNDDFRASVDAAMGDCNDSRS